MSSCWRAHHPGWRLPAARPSRTLGELPAAPMFWHIDRYATRAAAEMAKGARGTVVESLDAIWLFTIAEKGWRPTSGERVAEIGPLPVDAHRSYTAVYMQAVFSPGTTALVHKHSGPEAFYGLTGGICIETPDGRAVGEGDGHCSRHAWRCAHAADSDRHDRASRADADSARLLGAGDDDGARRRMGAARPVQALNGRAVQMRRGSTLRLHDRFGRSRPSHMERHEQRTDADVITIGKLDRRGDP